MLGEVEYIIFHARSLLRCPPLFLRAALSTPAFSTQLLFFARATLSTPTISVAPNNIRQTTKCIKKKTELRSIHRRKFIVGNQPTVEDGSGESEKIKKERKKE